ncbi:MAG: DUF805 domain-containing protein [Burkholderiaceae bacterium]
MNWFLTVLKKYAVFTGRAQRAEYWYFVLIYTIIYFVLGFVDRLFGATRLPEGPGLLAGIFVLATLLPSLAVGARRLHDTNRSGWWLLISLVPLVGWIVLLVFTVQDGTPGDNRFGPNPKGQLAP